MALVSPGVEVKVVDESFYTPAEPGTLPCIFVATASNKPNGAGTGTAPGTLSANAGTPYLITSQRDLVDTFGDPIFKTDNNNNPIHGGELNEYGLQAAYSYLGIANRAYIVRADVDLAALEGSPTAPGADPVDGTYWLDTSTSLWGIQEWNGASILNSGQNFTVQTPVVITSTTDLVVNGGSVATNGIAGDIPKKSIGLEGSYAVVATTTLNKIFYRATTEWVLVGSDAWRKSWASVRGTAVNTVFSNDIGAVAADFAINGVTIAVSPGNTVEDVKNTIITNHPNGNITAAVVDGRLEIYSDGTDGVGGTVEAIVLANNPSADINPLSELGITFDVGTGQATYYVPALEINPHTIVPEFKSTAAQPRPTGSVWLKTTSPNKGMAFLVQKWNDSTKLWEQQDIAVYGSNQEALYTLDRSGGGSTLLTGEIYAQTNIGNASRPVATVKFYRRNDVAPLQITGSRITTQMSGNAQTFTVQVSDAGQLDLLAAVTISVDFTGTTTDAIALADAINGAGIKNLSASVSTQNKVTISHSLGGEIKLVDTDGVLASAGFIPYEDETTGVDNLYYWPGTDTNTSPWQLQGSLWKVLNYTASDTEVVADTADNSLWYSSIIDEVDILVHNGTEFVGYQYDGASGMSGTASPYYTAVEADQTDPNGPIISASMPKTQSDNTALVTGDLWIDTSNIELYPQIYRYNNDRTDLPKANRWFILDTSDQTTEDGILFADARYNTSGVNSGTPGDIVDLLSSDYVDPDSPDPALYPKGMLLFNLRRSGFNVKRYRKNYFDLSGKNVRYNNEAMTGLTPETTYFADRWVTESGNQNDGSGSFGSIAQRKVVVQQLQALVNGNDEIRDDESRLFNLMACPGYPELIGEMNSLNYDRNLSAFIVGDSPFRLQPNATVLNEWATNVNGATEDNIVGLTSADPYIAVYYPSGFTSDNFGNNIVVPASHMMLRTIALSDQVSYPWFAPAGTRRGNITNATSSGTVTAEGEFKTLAMNEGLRDTLYSNNVNPITFITGAGLVCFGQKTRQLTASSLDRINVARLIIYLRSQLKVLAKPYLFEPNDKITRDEIKQQTETLLLELVGLRALYDFLVVCDESNNTPARIDRNELYVDIAIEPVKAIEFIYIPLRIKNTGEISGL